MSDYKTLKNQGLCVACRIKIDNGRTKCPSCAKKDVERSKKRQKKLIADGICKDCSTRPIVCSQRCQKCYEKHRETAVKRNARIRAEVLEAYGGAKCACCGETEEAFLSIDHIDNSGSEHRKQVKGNIYEWYRKQGFPPGYQVLCMNCNFAKGKLGYCPHSKK